MKRKRCMKKNDSSLGLFQQSNQQCAGGIK